jgi:receptor-type tyrosine-protein phosphatase beta
VRPANVHLLLTAVPLIQSEVVVVVDRDQPDSLTLRYTPTPVQSSRFDLYRFRISDGVNTTQERIVNDTDTKVTFTDLTPGRLYNVTVWTVSDKVESRPLLRQDRLCECVKASHLPPSLLLFPAPFNRPSFSPSHECHSNA